MQHHQTKSQPSRALAVEQLECRRLLAVIHGTVRSDVGADQQLDQTEPGIPGIVIYIDMDNDGRWSPTEPQTISSQDNVETPEDESGQYSFEVPPGVYTIRQHLDADAPPQPDAQIRRFLQTAPLRNPQLANPLSTPYGQWNDQFNPIEYILEWSGTVENVNAPLIPENWQATVAGTHVSFSMTYAYNPSIQPELNPQQQSLNFQSIDHYSWRLESGSEEAGVAEFAAVDQTATRFTIQPDTQSVQFSVPLQSGIGLRLEVDALLLPNVDPFRMPRASEIVEPQRFRVVQSDGPGRNVIIEGIINAQQFHANRAIRFGHAVQLPQDEGIPLDFWNTPDDDEDGLPNAWEEEGGGIDINGDGVVDLDLFTRGADPFHKDIFVEVDAMSGRGPRSASVDLSDLSGIEPTGSILDHVVRAFAESPVSNPDGLGGIRLHIELDETDIPITPFLDPETPWDEFDTLKREHVGGSDARSLDANRDQVVDARRFVYRYGLFADSQASGSTGMAELPGNDFFLTLGDWPHDLGDGTIVGGGSPEQQAGTFMHELGHTFGLRHGGDDDLNYKPNYLSVMNYHWQVPNSNVGWALDYSHEGLPSLDPNALDEPSGIGASPLDSRREVFVGPAPYRRVPVDSPVDWNRDGDMVDVDVAAPIHRTVFLDPDSGPRTYDMTTTGGPEFDAAIHGHDDWSLQAEDMMFFDDPEFSEGVHACDDPESPEAACYEDMTDFFSLSVSPDPFEPESMPIDVSVFDLSDWFVADFDDGTWTGVFSIHNEFDHDTFRWTGDTEGIFRVSATFVPGSMFEPELFVLDHDNNRVGTESRDAGRVGIHVDLDDVGPGELRIVIKNAGVDVDLNSPPGLDVDPATSYRYLLEIYGPRVPSLPDTLWSGSSSEDGSPGDGTSWSDENNWSVDGVPDTAPRESSVYGFDDASNGNTIDLGQGRTVDALQFGDTFEICSSPCDHTITVSSGVIDVAPTATVTINATTSTENAAILTKRNQGKLIHTGESASIFVADGALSGNVRIDGHLRVGPKATLSPGSESRSLATITATEQFVLDGTLVVDVDSTSNDVVTADEVRLGPSSALIVGAEAAIANARTEIRRTIVDAGIAIEATTDQDTFQFVRAADLSDSLVSNHAGFGVFLKAIDYMAESIDAVLYQAGAGDANGDGIFNSTDLILALSGGAYEKDRFVTWVHGDWNGDGRFESGDLVLALQQGTYTANSHAQRNANLFAASFLDELDQRERNSGSII